jgi:hypothetical protein
MPARDRNGNLRNRTEKGWLVPLLNPPGNNRRQHGAGSTDPAQERGRDHPRRSAYNGGGGMVHGGSPRPARDGDGATVRVTVPAGSVRSVELNRK